MKYTYTFSTNPFMHKVSKGLVFCAKEAGVFVEYDNDGGWLTRKHFLVVKGTEADIATFECDSRLWCFNRLLGCPI